MAILSSPTLSVFGKLAKSVALAAALFAGGAAQAGLIDFETVESPIVLDGQRTALGNYIIDSFGEGVPGALVGTMGTNDLCFNVGCPANNSTSYYNVLADSYFVLARRDNQQFKVRSLDASYLGMGATTFNGIAGAIELIGFDKFNQEVAYTPLFLSGPIGGKFLFDSFDLGVFGDTRISYMLAIGYGCDTTGCTRSENRGNFAIDNILVDVPEPGSFALMGLGLLGLGFATRRRAA